MRKIFLLALLSLPLACVPQDQLADLPGVPSSPKDVTDLNLCQGQTPPGSSALKGSWQVDHQDAQGNLSKDVTKFESNAVSLTTTCVFKGTEVTITSRANATIFSQSGQILANDSAQSTIRVGNEEKTCANELRSGTVLSFSFQGPCLKVTANGKTQTMIPAK